MPNPTRRKPDWLVIAAIVVAVGIGVYVYLFYVQMYHFAVVTPGVLYRMGVRDQRELVTTIRRVHPKTVVCLVMDKEVNDPAKPQFRDEFAILKKNGIRLVRIPMNYGGPPTQAQVDEFLKIVTNKANQPVIVHCAQGVIRTGEMVAAYDRDILGYSEQQTIDAVRNFGKESERRQRVCWFIRQYYSQQAQADRQHDTAHSVATSN